MSVQISSSNDQRRLYGDLAWMWPIISRKENYIEEADEFRRLIREHSRIEARTILHLGCGGGHIDFTLKKHFEVTGVDVSEAMLSLARRLNPEVTYLLGDMRAVRLGKNFDAVMVADSIDYMLTLEELRAAFVTAFEHLKPGGVFCTYAEVTVESFKQNETQCSTHAQGDVEITFIENRYDPDPKDTTYENVFVYLIRRGGQLEIHTDCHLGGIFHLETWLDLLKGVGFEVEQVELDEEHIPMFVCVKPA
jgi:trans-aconitate methyltransferase